MPKDGLKNIQEKIFVNANKENNINIIDFGIQINSVNVQCLTTCIKNEETNKRKKRQIEKKRKKKEMLIISKINIVLSGLFEVA